MTQKILIQYIRPGDPTVRFDYFTPEELHELEVVNKEIEQVLVKQREVEE